jgi:hypothetical protein
MVREAGGIEAHMRAEPRAILPTQHALARFQLSLRGMNPGIVEDDVLTPDLTLPIQFRDIWHGARFASPETILAVSVLGQAANDLQTYRFARRRRNQRLYSEAYNWVASDDRSWPYAFVNLCEALRLSTESVRARLLADALPAAQTHFRSAARATSRAPSDRSTAMVFRLSRPANVKPMKIVGRATGRGRRRATAS